VRHFASSFAPAMQVRRAGVGTGRSEWTKRPQISSEACTVQLGFRQEHDQLGWDLVDSHSERRRQRTREQGVPFPHVALSLVMPQTFMNRSGTAARQLVDQEKFRLKGKRDQLLVVCDDVTIPFGQIRFRAKGGHGGQNGLRDLLRRLGTEVVPRLRIGIGPAHGTLADGVLEKYVLGRFRPDEVDAMDPLLHHACQVIRVYLHRGPEAAAQVANSM